MNTGTEIGNIETTIVISPLVFNLQLEAQISRNCSSNSLLSGMVRCGYILA